MLHHDGRNLRIASYTQQLVTRAVQARTDFRNRFNDVQPLPGGIHRQARQLTVEIGALIVTALSSAPSCWRRGRCLASPASWAERRSGLGFAVHLVIAALIGATYGLLFHHEATDERAAVAWGTLYGSIWWFLGPLTLFPILLGGTFTWTTAAASAQLPSLIGHMIYGVSLALTFRALERRHLQELFVDERLKRRGERRRRPAGTSAPAVWLFFIGTSVVLPIVLG